MDDRLVPTRLGRLGEAIAAHFIADRGCTIIDRNVRVGSDEIDLIVDDGGALVAVEVKCSANGDDPVAAVDDEKFSRLTRAVDGYEGRIGRIDIMAVSLDRGGVTVRWLIAVQ